MKHRLSFPVRYYECDAYHHVNHANYIRYMGEAAAYAAAQVGYTSQTLAEINRVWIAREHQIEFINPLRTGDIVHIDTWVTDFRRVRSLRCFEIYANDQLAARATTDWVFVDTTTGRPTTVPPEMEEAFRAKNYSDDIIFPRDRFPKPAPQPEYVGNIHMPVEWRDIDSNQHVNNAAYFSYHENGIMALCAELGWTMERMNDAGFGIIVRKYRIEYREPAVFDDTLICKTWISDIRRATAVRHYELSRAKDGAICTRGRAMYVWVDLKTQKPIRIPKHFIADFSTNQSPE